MEIFRELLIRGTPEQFYSAVQQIDQTSADGWFHDRVAEGQLNALTLRTEPVTCFSCTETEVRPAASLYLMRNGSGSFCATNVIPMAKHRLSHGEYNAILAEFNKRFGAVFEAQGLTVELTASVVDLDHWLNPDAAAMLRMFSAKASKGTGGAHPRDRERWNAFVVTAFRDASTLDAYTLRRWLIEIEGWPPEVGTLTISNLSCAEVIVAAGGRLAATSNLRRLRANGPPAVPPTAKEFTAPKLLSGSFWKSVVSALGISWMVAARAEQWLRK